MVGSYGALATLLFGAPASPFAQPRMVVGAHALCCTIAVAMDYFIESDYTSFTTSFVPQVLARGRGQGERGGHLPVLHR